MILSLTENAPQRVARTARDGNAADLQTSPDDLSLAVLIVAPAYNDAALTASFVRSAGWQARICSDIGEVIEVLDFTCGAVLIAEEAMDDRSVAALSTRLVQQPSWSDIPIIVVTTSGAETEQRRLRRIECLRQNGKVILVERPFRPVTLVSTLEVALRSRRRQYEARDLLEERSQMSARAEEQARIFDTILSTITDFACIFDRAGRFVHANKALLNFLALPLEQLVGKTHFDLPYPKDVAAHLQRQIKRVFETGEVQREEIAHTGPNGAKAYYEMILSPVLSAAGIVNVVVGSTRDVTERRRAEEALREQADALRNADRRKDEFLAMLAHELRNPLASVLGAAKVLRCDHDADAQLWATGVIDRQTGQLGRLIDDLLDVSRITSGKIRLRCGVVDAAHALERACESVRPLCNERSHLLECDFRTGELWVFVDATRLEQAVSNLLTNAAKYTPAGGRIELSARREGEKVKIRVSDNGMGIPPDRLPEMFELFAQGERSIARSEGGLGIGLTIVQRLVEMHGGTVQAHSAGLDQGSTFTIVLPAVAAPVAAVSVKRPAPGENRGLRILVVDDNVDTAEAMSRLLRRRGHEVQTAHDGNRGLGLACEFCPDVVVLDIGLPGLDGYQVAAKLRADSRCGDCLIVAVSGYGQDEDRRRSREAGFDHHFVKPVDVEEITALIQQPRSRGAVAAG